MMKRIILYGGVDKITADAMLEALRDSPPPVIAVLDKNAKVTIETIELCSTYECQEYWFSEGAD